MNPLHTNLSYFFRVNITIMLPSTPRCLKWCLYFRFLPKLYTQFFYFVFMSL